MKKILLIVLITFISSALYGQKKVRPGIKMGANYSTITNLGYDRQWGLLLGGLVNIQFSDFYAMQPELLYSRQGARSVKNAEKSVQIDYVSLGFTNKFFMMNDQKFHLLAGINLDFDFDDSLYKFVNNGFNDDIFFFDVAFYGGLGYQFDIGLTCEARYKQGTIEVFTEDFFTGADNHLNSSFQFCLAYTFNY